MGKSFSIFLLCLGFSINYVQFLLSQILGFRLFFARSIVTLECTQFWKFRLGKSWIQCQRKALDIFCKWFPQSLFLQKHFSRKIPEILKDISISSFREIKDTNCPPQKFHHDWAKLSLSLFFTHNIWWPLCGLNKRKKVEYYYRDKIFSRKDNLKLTARKNGNTKIEHCCNFYDKR